MYTATVNHIQSLRSQICIYTYTFFTIQRRLSDKKCKRIRTRVNVACKGNFSDCHFGHARNKFFNLDLGFAKLDYKLYG